MKKKLIVLCIILIVNLSEASFSFIEPQNSIDLLKIDATLDNFQSTHSELPPSKKTIIKHFCKVALQDAISKGFDSEQDLYSSQNSIFMRFLCKETKTLTDQSVFSPFLQDSDESYFLENAAKKIWFPEQCQTEELWECNLYRLSRNTITKTLDELFTIKHANLYGLTNINFTSQKNIEEQINAFMQHYFFQEEKEITDDFCQGKNHKYPQTCKIMKNNLKTFKNSFKNFKILNTKQLFKDSEIKLQQEQKPENEYCYYTKDKSKSYDYLFCGLLETNTRGLKPFKNLIYNELLWHNLFSSYASQQLELRPQPNKEIVLEITMLKQAQNKILELANSTLEELSHIQHSYPLHIGMLMYQEDLLKLRTNSLAKLVNPFYSLFYKLQNVQIPN